MGRGVAVLLVAGAITQLWPAGRFEAWWDRAARLPVVVQAAGLAVAFVLLDALGPDGVAPFLYFAF